MRTLSSGVTTALAARALVARTFIWVTAKDPANGNTPVSLGLWNDLGQFTASVIDGLTGSTVSRLFYGSGTLVDLGDLPLTSDTSIRTVTATLSQVDTTVAQLVRGYDVRRAPVQIYRGLFNVASRTLVAAAPCRFVGFVDKCVITTPKEGAFGSVSLDLVSFAREMTRASTECRSHASQQVRTGNADGFYKYTGVAAQWTLFWGTKRSPSLSRPVRHPTRKKHG